LFEIIVSLIVTVRSMYTVYEYEDIYFSLKLGRHAACGSDTGAREVVLESVLMEGPGLIISISRRRHLPGCGAAKASVGVTGSI
jgi:hypothetical protein